MLIRTRILASCAILALACACSSAQSSNSSSSAAPSAAGSASPASDCDAGPRVANHARADDAATPIENYDVAGLQDAESDLQACAKASRSGRAYAQLAIVQLYLAESYYLAALSVRTPDARIAPSAQLEAFKRLAAQSFRYQDEAKANIGLARANGASGDDLRAAASLHAAVDRLTQVAVFQSLPKTRTALGAMVAGKFPALALFPEPENR